MEKLKKLRILNFPDFLKIKNYPSPHDGIYFLKDTWRLIEIFLSAYRQGGGGCSQSSGVIHNMGLYYYLE